MTPAARPSRTWPAPVLVFFALVTWACEAHRTAEFYIELGAPTPEGLDTQRALERVLERRVGGAGLRSFSLQWTGTSTAVVRVTGVRDLGRTARWLALRGTMEFRLMDMGDRFRGALPAIDTTLAEAGIPSAETAAARAAPGQILDLEPAASATAWGPLGSRLRYAGLPGQFVVAEPEVALVDSLIRISEVQALIPPPLQLV